jgi:transposase-like protein
MKHVCIMFRMWHAAAVTDMLDITKRTKRAKKADRVMAMENVKRFQRTPDFVKVRAMQLYAEVGPVEASRRMGIDRSTLDRWRRQIGLPSKRIVDIKPEDVEHALRQQRMYRADMQNLLVQKTRMILLMMNEDTIPEDMRHLAQAAGVLIDKYRLEAGEATSRSERTTHTDEIGSADLVQTMRAIRAELAKPVEGGTDRTPTGSDYAVPGSGEAELVRTVSS